MRTKALKNTLALLLAALALTFFAACSSESDPDPAYCGTWTPTDALISYLNTALANATTTAAQATQLTSLYNSSDSITLSTSDISLTISSNNTITITVYSIMNIPGTYTYSGSDSSGTFNFTLDYSNLSSYGEAVSGMAELIGKTFTANAITYTTGSLSAVLGEESSGATTIFTK